MPAFDTMIALQPSSYATKLSIIKFSPAQLSRNFELNGIVYLCVHAGNMSILARNNYENNNSMIIASSRQNIHEMMKLSRFEDFYASHLLVKIVLEQSEVEIHLI